MPVQIDGGEYLLLWEAAQEARVSPACMRQLIADGRVVAVRMGNTGRNRAGIFLVSKQSVDRLKAELDREPAVVGAAS